MVFSTRIMSGIRIKYMCAMAKMCDNERAWDVVGYSVEAAMDTARKLIKSIVFS